MPEPKRPKSTGPAGPFFDEDDEATRRDLADAQARTLEALRLIAGSDRVCFDDCA
jgi:hypothetical protein